MKTNRGRVRKLFGDSVLGEKEYLSILTPETGTIGYEMHIDYMHNNIMNNACE